MFCYQCEQTAQGKGCTQVGVCGKQPETAALQDLLIYALKGLAMVAVEATRNGCNNADVNRFMAKGLFSTLTNVDFDPERFVALIRECVQLRDALKKDVVHAGGRGNFRLPEANFQPGADLRELVGQGQQLAGIAPDPDLDPDVEALKQLLIYGLKGTAAYAHHAALLGFEDPQVYDFLNEGMMAALNSGISMQALIYLVIRCGETNLRAMKLLDEAHTTTYGHPAPTPVPLGAKKGKAILVSGHDLKDLEEILKQSEGKGINVYTHGEMLPAHGYPGLKKYPHFYGHYGTAWQNQQREFAAFPGAILMTTNCLQKPQPAYQGNLFTTDLVGWPGIPHLKTGDFGPVIEKALQLPGFPEDVPGKTVTTGFGHHAVIGVADKIVELVKAGKIRHFFLVGGCDGAKPGRSYYTEFVEKVPKDCVVLTLACGKFRFFDKDLGAIDGIPRLIDLGQCNDAYSAIMIVDALAKAFNCNAQELPVSLVLSWYEQKAVAILLSLLFLNFKNIRLGPTLPAFVTPKVLDFLVKNFNLMPIGTPDADLKAILG
ncbi:MAG: hydroxylamine reductase [Deltaproteobacteria bacterium]|nr:hydroxylamine reductase [Deltaproteobacteria bacterium]